MIDFFEQLWKLDRNRLTPGVDYCLDLQRRAKKGTDNARDPLFSRVDPTVFKKPTYKGMNVLIL